MAATEGGDLSVDKRTSTPTRPPEPTSYTVDGNVHTWVFDGGVTVVVCHPHYDRAGRLWGEIVAMVDGVPVNQAQINLLDQRQRIDFYQVAMGRDGRVDWQDYLLSIIRPVQAALDREGGDVDDALAVRSDPWPVLDKKALSWSTPQYIFAAIEGDWAKDRVTSGLSSGEGLIYAVRDERWEKQPIRARGRVVDYQRVLVDEGVSDKRLMIVEEEFSQALKVMSRDGNILSPILRQAWEPAGYTR
jgi:hypothetical protein